MDDKSSYFSAFQKNLHFRIVTFLEDCIFVAMRIEKLKREQTGLFSDLANALVYRQNELLPFLAEPFSLAAFEQQMHLKKGQFTAKKRQILADVLARSYQNEQTTDLQKENMQLLKADTTFTVTTGHQLSLFTGPLYFVIKILHIVNLTKLLKEKYPTADFIPVFWMATEDHDFEEINGVNLFNQNRQWQTEQTGAVGRFGMENWSTFQNELKELYKNHPESEIVALIDQYKGENLAEATFHLVNALFGHYGLLALDGDNLELKKLFAPLVKQELLVPNAQTEVEKKNLQLNEAGYSPQAHAREINLFLLGEQSRERIQAKGQDFYVEGIGDVSRAEMLKRLEDNPQQFSPNVILRPVYQETVLPNLCYVGGGGEMAYWLQLKGVFETFQIPFPLIQVRVSLLMIDSQTQTKMESVDWTYQELFQDVEMLKKQYVLNHTEELDLTELNSKKESLIATATEMVLKVAPNLKGWVEAEMTRLTKQMDSLEQKLMRAEKSKFEKSLKHMDQIKDKLFPNGGLQERSTNFFQFCADGEVFTHLENLRLGIDPLENDFTICYF